MVTAEGVGRVHPDRDASALVLLILGGEVFDALAPVGAAQKPDLLKSQLPPSDPLLKD